MKYALVTGGNRGLGLGFVKYLTSCGYTVFAGYRTSWDHSDISNVVPIQLDVTDDLSIGTAVREVRRHTNTLDLLVNNAGVSRGTIVKNNKGLTSNIDQLDRETLLTMFNINSVSPLMVIKGFRELLETSSSSFIINISSARASFFDEYGYDTPNYGYRGSKAALNIITKDLTTELPKSIKTFSVDPGDVHTDMNSSGSQDTIQTASKIMDIVKNWKEENNGMFMRFSGEQYPR